MKNNNFICKYKLRGVIVGADWLCHINIQTNYCYDKCEYISCNNCLKENCMKTAEPCRSCILNELYRD